MILRRLVVGFVNDGLVAFDEPLVMTEYTFEDWYYLSNMSPVLPHPSRRFVAALSDFKASIYSVTTVQPAAVRRFN